MPLIPDADDLRTLNLAYRHLQRTFRNLMPDLFRETASITTTSTGYLYLPTYVHEVEDIRLLASPYTKVDRIDKEQRFHLSGYYHDGMVADGGADDGKRRVMVRIAGAAAVSVAYSVSYLREYSDLATTSSVPYPFTSKAYLDMLTTLQAWYWLSEQGEERLKEKADKWKDFQAHYELASLDTPDDEPEYGMTSHSDAGEYRSGPILTVGS